MLSDNVSTYALAAKELEQLLRTSEEASSSISYPTCYTKRELQHRKSPTAKLGDVVLVHDDTLRRLVVMEED